MLKFYFFALLSIIWFGWSAANIISAGNRNEKAVAGFSAFVSGMSVLGFIIAVFANL